MKRPSFQFVLTTTLLLAAVAVAAENAPDHIYGTYSSKSTVCFSAANSCEEGGLNSVEVSPEARGAKVEVSLIFAEAHECKLEGHGEWKDGRLIVTLMDGSLAKVPGINCQLELHFTRSSVRFNDVEDKIQQRSTSCPLTARW